MKIIAGLVASSVAVVVGCTHAEQCIDDGNAYYNQGLSRILAANGVASSVQPGRGVCFAEGDAPKVKAAERELERYFFEVADTLRNSCDEAAVVAWASREKLPFEVHDTIGSDGRPSFRMINIYSFSQAEVESNRRKLSEAPRIRQCEAKP
jgi:hypothetical protein